MRLMVRAHRAKEVNVYKQDNMNEVPRVSLYFPNKIKIQYSLYLKNMITYMNSMKQITFSHFLLLNHSSYHP